MKIKIYQINLDRDKNRLRCVSYKNLEKFQSKPDVDSRIYDCIYEGSVACKNLEEVFLLFNGSHPDDFEGYSLLASDVVEVCQSDLIEPGFYYCDSVGFCKVDFDPEECGVGQDKEETDTSEISVLLVEPGNAPEVIEIPNTLEAMQELVNGYIEMISPFDDDIAIVCNEEGKINCLPLNRAIYIESEPETISYAELKQRFCDHEQGEAAPLEGYVVFSEDSFKRKYPEKERTYVFSSRNKAFMPNVNGNSIYGYCLDGDSSEIRLDQYIMEENPKSNGWKVERFYLKDRNKKKLVEIIAGTFFICYAPIDSDKFLSIPSDLARKYTEIFRKPETFFIKDGKIMVKAID